MKQLFILGCPRSGTTLLQQALNRHSQIVIPPETKFFYYLYGRSHRCQQRFLMRLNGDLRINIQVPAGRIRTADEARAFYAEMARLYLRRLSRESVAYFGDKTPEHTGRLECIREVFPEAKIVVLYRDGRDVALSLSKMPWIQCDVYVGLLIWLYYQRLLKELRLYPLMDAYYLRYENLVQDSAEELCGLLRFLGLPYEAQVAEGYGNREGIPEREYPWKDRAMQRITAERVGRWRRELTFDEIDKLERLGGHTLVDLGYELSSDSGRRLSPWFLATLVWRAAICAAHLPPGCVASELAACAKRVWSKDSTEEQLSVREIREGVRAASARAG